MVMSAVSAMSALRPLMLQERRQSGHGNTSRSCHFRTHTPQQRASLFGHTLKRDHQYKLSPIDIPAMADGSPQLF
jgi:hypothetical protein